MPRVFAFLLGNACSNCKPKAWSLLSHLCEIGRINPDINGRNTKHNLVARLLYRYSNAVIFKRERQRKANEVAYL